MAGLTVRPFEPRLDLDWAEALLVEGFAGRLQARRGELMDPLAGEGLVAESSGERVGLVTWLLDPEARVAEIRLIVVIETARRRGVGSVLLGRALLALAGAACRRAWVVTTNDALDALALYQRQGFHLVALRPGAVDLARATLKPAIGRVGAGGIPIRDELELALDL